MNINDIENKRSVQIIEELPRFGILNCKTIYEWSEGPKIYVVHNDKHRFLVYFLKKENRVVTYLYIPITDLEQVLLENHERCIRTIIAAKDAYVLKVMKDKCYFEEDKIQVRGISIDLLPKVSTYVTHKEDI